MGLISILNVIYIMYSDIDEEVSQWLKYVYERDEDKYEDLARSWGRIF